MVVLATLGAPQRRMLRGRRPTAVTEAAPEPVPTSRATLVAAEPFPSPADADAWLDRLRADETAMTDEVDDAVRRLNIVLRAHRAAAFDPYAREVSSRGALAVRVGHGSGEQVADGKFTAAYELPRGAAAGSAQRGAARRRDALGPQERLAAILSGRDHVLVAEELVLRARADVDSGQTRQAALQARVALEALIADLGRERQETAGLSERRTAIGAAANAALDGDLSAEHAKAVTAAVDAMERALRHRAAGDRR